MPIVVAALYKFVPIETPEALRERLLDLMRPRGLRGTILVAPEGINGTISGPPGEMAGFVAELRADARFADIEVKEALAAAHPFQRLKVKVKREIITLRKPEANPSVAVGAYVAPEDWNGLIAQPDVLVLDTRNTYEVQAGTFERAVDPDIASFGAFPDFVAESLDPQRHRRIAMFCTGGIRCEKASAYLKHLGFEEVYQLKGGILAYLAKVPAGDSLWRGECFVFDERETVTPETRFLAEGREGETA
ncbi:MAG: rhodanese-related sulfurtransferase [Hyphomicrobiaceae bacterium]|nr:rhodanese-related sulfurtransferase [Hyphomicrobiaceae bacterium]